MEFIAKQIAEMIGGRVEGNENAAINSFAKIEEEKPVPSRSCRTPNTPTIFTKHSRALCSSTRMLNWSNPLLPR